MSKVAPSKGSPVSNECSTAAAVLYQASVEEEPRRP
jgi:hypothetical protein